MAREFIVPGEIISGSGALDMAEGALKLLGKKALIVTDKVMIDLGNCAKVEKALTNQGIEYSIYSDICGEPTDTMIEKGLQIYKDENCDFLVALGGGSPIDSMKAIGSLVVNGGSISDYMGKVIDVKMPPMAADPLPQQERDLRQHSSRSSRIPKKTSRCFLKAKFSCRILPLLTRSLL